jgi:hypothetical protein
VIEMLITRFYYLNDQYESLENHMIILLLKNIRKLMYKRLSKKIQRVKKLNEASESKY